VRRVSAPSDHVAVVGVGASLLIADLLDHGYTHVEAIDIAAPALDQLRRLLGPRADLVTCRVADARQLSFDEPVTVWHDRAVFHFLVDESDRRQYAARAAAAVARGGHLAVATFALDGPDRCSGLPVVRYDATSLAAEFWPDFEPVESERVEHITPSGTSQAFVHLVLRRR
jgi:hypothetical protein